MHDRTSNLRTGLLLILLLGLSACQHPQSPARTSQTYENGFLERSRILTAQVGENYKPTYYSDRGKYSFPVVVARMLDHGLRDDRAAAYLEEYADGKFEFFHFPFVGLARIFGLFPEAPAVVANREDFLSRILFHDPKYHYNALTGEGTENHVSMSRTSGYLFAQEAMRYPLLKDRANEWESQLKEWIIDWPRRIYAYGTGEWDSNPYTAYNLIGWLNLYDFAKDPEVRVAARAVVDYYAANIALKLTQGLLGGPESRGSSSYGALPRSATEYLGWLWFGEPAEASRVGFFQKSEYIQSMHAATSSYRPPLALLSLARKEIPTPAIYHNTKPDYLLQAKGDSHETFLIEDTFTLGTAQTPYGGWINAAYGVINWKLIIENPTGLPAVIIGNGGMKSTTNPRGRNPFDQFFQYRNVVVQMTRVPQNAAAIEAEVDAIFDEWKEAAERDFETRWDRPHMFKKTHVSNSGKGSLEDALLSILHIPESLHVTTRQSRAFLKYADTFVAVETLSGRPPLLEPGRFIDREEPGRISGFVVEVVNSREFPSFEDFVASVDRRPQLEQTQDGTTFHYITGTGDKLDFSYSLTGAWKEMIFDWGSGVTEKRIGFNTPDWRQPTWPSGPGQGRIPSFTVNGHPMNFPGKGQVIDGPYIQLHQSILTINTPDDRHYTVDYTARLPKFSTVSE